MSFQQNNSSHIWVLRRVLVFILTRAQTLCVIQKTFTSAVGLWFQNIVLMQQIKRSKWIQAHPKMCILVIRDKTKGNIRKKRWCMSLFMNTYNIRSAMTNVRDDWIGKKTKTKWREVKRREEKRAVRMTLWQWKQKESHSNTHKIRVSMCECSRRLSR